MSELRSVGLAATVDVTQWDSFDTAERRHVLSNMTDGVFVRRAARRKLPVESRVWIAWRGDLPDDLPRRGRANGPVRGIDYPPDHRGMTASKDASDGVEASTSSGSGTGGRPV